MVTETERNGNILDLTNKDLIEDLNLAKNLGPSPIKSFKLKENISTEFLSV